MAGRLPTAVAAREARTRRQREDAARLDLP